MSVMPSTRYLIILSCLKIMPHILILNSACLDSDFIAFSYLQILKDITNRYKLLRGYKVEYTPGWDCHGMPIEQKALAQMKSDHTQLEPLDIRHKGSGTPSGTLTGGQQPMFLNEYIYPESTSPPCEAQ